MLLMQMQKYTTVVHVKENFSMVEKSDQMFTLFISAVTNQLIQQQYSGKTLKPLVQLNDIGIILNIEVESVHLSYEGMANLITQVQNILWELQILC